MEHNDYILQKFAFEYQTILECTWYRAKGYINKQLRSVLKNLPVETERKKKHLNLNSEFLMKISTMKQHDFRHIK